MTERKEFTDRQKDKSIREQSGLCYICNIQLIGRIDFDHKINCETFNDPNNDLNPADMNNDDNCGACHYICHKHKSRVETGERAKKKRQYKRYANGDAAGSEGSGLSSGLKNKTQWGKREIPSRPFDKKPKGYKHWT